MNPFPRIIGLYILSFLLIAMASSCTELSSFDESIINKELADSLMGVTNSRGVMVDIIVDGHIKVRASSPEARTVETEFASYTRFIGPPVEVVVYDSTGAVETTVSSRELTYKSYISIFEFEGNVFVETNQNRTLRAEQLEWNEQSKTISSPGFVIITSPSDSITGYGFVGDEDLVRYTLNRVTGQFSIND
jgi:LPS export ABC transporter protein LptC